MLRNAQHYSMETAKSAANLSTGRAPIAMIDGPANGDAARGPADRSMERASGLRRGRDEVEALANRRRILAPGHVPILALQREILAVHVRPVFQAAVALPVARGEIDLHLVEGRHRDVGHADEVARLVLGREDDPVVADCAATNAILLEIELHVGGRALLSLGNEVEQHVVIV